MKSSAAWEGAMGNIGPLSGHYDVLAASFELRVGRTMPDPVDPPPLPTPEPVPDPAGPGPAPVPSPPSDAPR